MSNAPIHSSEKLRLIGIAIGIFCLFSLLITQFYVIQIIEGQKWLTQAQRQHFIVIKEPFIRGTFYSNPYIKKGHPAEPQRFVIDVPKFHLFADCESIPAVLKGEMADYLSQNFHMTVQERLLLRSNLEKSSRNRKLASWLDKETHKNLLAWWYPYARKNKIPRNAIFFVKDYQRSYPFGKLLGQVLHTIQNQKDDVTHQACPTGGLELYFNDYLKGKQGKRRLMRSPRHSLETGEVIDYPEHGADIYLTINPCLQAIVEDEIEKGVKKSKAKCGWAVMMEPHTGEILALAQYPFFNLPEYQQYFNDPNLIEHTKVKAVTDANEPGSVFKPVTAAIALKANQYLKQKGEKELFSTEEKFATASGRFPGRSKPIRDTSTHHFLNFDMAMQKSSNIYMGRLAERIVSRLGNEWYSEQMRLFGFGQRTHIELPAESAGILPKPGKYHPNGALEWSLPTPFSLAMGYNLQANSIQMARALSVFANGGYLNQPTLVRRIVKKDPSGKEQLLKDNTTKARIQSFPKILDDEIVDRVLRAMRYVTKPGGTATKADLPGYSVVGKTSTPMKIVNGVYSEKLHCPTFGGFTPVKHAAFVLVITIDEPEYGYIKGYGKNHHGGNCTALVFRAIAKRSLEYLGIMPDDPFGYPFGDPRRDQEKALWMQETQKLKELYDKWNKLSPIGEK
jgi:cell division protein FtsI (penicillin-binding protein 3)